MRIPALLLIASLLPSCMTAPPSPERLAAQAAAEQAELAPLLAGKTPGRPLSCLPISVRDSMRVIGPNLVVFRDGSNRTYVNRMRGSCVGMNGHNALVTNHFGGSSSPCSGDIAQVVDPSTGAGYGSCVWGEFEQFTRS
jgi:hypothetical protein